MAAEKGFVDLRIAARWASVSPRTIRSWVHDPEHPLPAFRVRGKLLFKLTELEEWIETHRVETVDVEGVVDALLADVKERTE